MAQTENGNGAPTEPVEAAPTGVQQSFVSELFANIKWIAIGAVAGYAVCWFMGRKKK